MKEEEFSRVLNYESAYGVRIIRSELDARVLCAGEPQRLVYAGLCWLVPIGFGVWISQGRLAVRIRRIHLVDCGPEKVVAGAGGSRHLTTSREANHAARF